MTDLIWPLFGLRIRTPRLEIRMPTDEDCVALASLAADGVHDRAEMPFGVPWTDVAYTYNGEHLALRRGRPERHINLRLDRDTWQTHHRDDITIDGLAPCREMFGATLPHDNQNSTAPPQP